MGTFRTRTGFFCCFLMLFYAVSISSLWAAQTASIVISAETGKIHHEKNADAITHPASLTKMMTFYLAFKALREGKLTLDQKLPVSKHASRAAPCKLWLKPGSTITVKQALLGMATKSANDASIAVAETLAKSEPQFALMMTRQARQLGMTNTVFKNAHGLPNKQQVTTARDMAILARALYKDFPKEFKLFKTEKFVYKGQVYHNHNRLLGKIQGLDGIKTGFINASGFNLAASVVRDNHRIIAVVMGGESANARNKKMVKLLEATYSSLKGRNHPPQEKTHASISDLLYTLAPSEANAAPSPQPKGKILKAVDRSQTRSKKVLKTQYRQPRNTSIDDLLNDVDQKRPVSKKPKKTTKKQAIKKPRTKIKKPLHHKKKGLKSKKRKLKA